MVHHVTISRLPDERPVPWPPDDTEESVLGTNFHQRTITNLRIGLNEAARAAVEPERPISWFAYSQTIMRGFRRRDGSRIWTLPDVFVLVHDVDERRPSLHLRQDGVPLLIIEVASDTTADADLDLEEGKGYLYARARVAEYMVMDPTGEWVPEGVRAWQLQGGRYQPWMPEADGRWHSRQIAAQIALEGAMAGVFTPSGRRMPREGEIYGELIQRERELAQRDDEIARLRRLLDEQQDELPPDQ
jgi:Uma2 family endonuclease